MNLKININERRAQTPPCQKSTYCMISQSSRKGKLIYSDSKSAVAWGWGWAEGKITMGQEKTFGNIYYHDCDDGFSGVFTDQNISNCTL